MKKAYLAGVGLGLGQLVLMWTMALTFWFGGWLISRKYMDFASVLKVCALCALSALYAFALCMCQVGVVCVCVCVFVCVCVCVCVCACVRSSIYIRRIGSLSCQVIFAIMMSAQGAGQAGAFAPDAEKASLSTRSIFAVMDRQADIDSESTMGSDALTIADAAIEFDNVVFAYPTRQHIPVYRGFSLHVPAGKRIALVGQSGWYARKLAIFVSHQRCRSSCVLRRFL
jgi:ABC-type multidrug transport system fused ATPase/permease subunit